MGTLKGLAGTFAVVTLLAWSFGAQALAADAKAELIEREHKCNEAPTLDEALECYDSSDDLVVYDINTPREFDGPKALRADFQPFFDNFKNPKYEYSNERVIIAGKLAFTNLIVHMTATDKSGKAVDMTWRATNVWRKENGTWKIIHAHYSVPVDMASGKADMQSKP
ncbi:MAG: nuclear transport factor 2 family protein [Candidatus Binatus sp.]|jgi:ketosteroid isomerase-like protein